MGIAEIARRAGVGNATVFRRFPSKDALYEAILDEKIAELVAAATRAGEIGDPWDALVRYVETSAELQARDRGFFQATEQYLLERPELMRRHRVILDAVDPLVVRAQARRAGDDVTTLDVLGLVKGAVACVPPGLPPTAGDARWPSSSTLCGRGPRPRCRSRRSPTRRSRVPSASPPTTDLPTPDEVRRIAAIADPVLRNLEITACYASLAAAMAARGDPCSNWCTFATWASRQAGRTIRGEDLLGALEHELGRDAELLHPVDAFWRDARPPRPVPAATRRSAGSWPTCTRRSMPSSSPATPSRAATARCSPRSACEFARYLHDCDADLRPDSAAFTAFLDGLAPGEPPEGQRYLRQAFTRYQQQRFEPDPNRRAELVVLANLEIGLHEQTRLQPEIGEALDAAATTGDRLSGNLVRRLLGVVVQRGLTRLEPRGDHALVHGADAARRRARARAQPRRALPRGAAHADQRRARTAPRALRARRRGTGRLRRRGLGAAHAADALHRPSLPRLPRDPGARIGAVHARHSSSASAPARCPTASSSWSS